MAWGSVKVFFVGLVAAGALFATPVVSHAEGAYTTVKGSERLSYMKATVQRMGSKVQVMTKYDFGDGRTQDEVIVMDCARATYKITLSSISRDGKPVSLANASPFDKEILGSEYADLYPVLCSGKKKK